MYLSHTVLGWKCGWCTSGQSVWILTIAVVYCDQDKTSVRLTGLQRLGEKGEKMMNMLQQVREILPHYRSGALPKVFKVLPKFEAWEEVKKLVELESLWHYP